MTIVVEHLTYNRHSILYNTLRQPNEKGTQPHSRKLYSLQGKQNLIHKASCYFASSLRCKTAVSTAASNKIPLGLKKAKCISCLMVKFCLTWLCSLAIDGASNNTLASRTMVLPSCTKMEYWRLVIAKAHSFLLHAVPVSEDQRQIVEWSKTSNAVKSRLTHKTNTGIKPSEATWTDSTINHSFKGNKDRFNFSLISSRYAIQ